MYYNWICQQISNDWIDVLMNYWVAEAMDERKGIKKWKIERINESVSELVNEYSNEQMKD